MRARRAWSFPELGWKAVREGTDTILFRRWFPSALLSPALGCLLAGAFGFGWIGAGLPALELWPLLFPAVAVIVYRALAGCLNYTYVRISRSGAVSRWFSPLPWICDVAVRQRRIAAVGIEPVPLHAGIVGRQCNIVLLARDGNWWPLVRMAAGRTAAATARQLGNTLSAAVLCELCGAPLTRGEHVCRQCRTWVAPALPARSVERMPVAGFRPVMAPLFPISPLPAEPVWLAERFEIAPEDALCVSSLSPANLS